MDQVSCYTFICKTIIYYTYYSDIDLRIHKINRAFYITLFFIKKFDLL